ncbi:MAG: winged helix-turn-helix transcriptional regulator [Oscillospiraceae bacterium]|nr:winged helix-turn-helix transcriptional regulator [Oscillospiraceae bacterium]
MAQEKTIAGFFKALGDENRIKILRMISREECCASELLEELEISQPTLSHHMRILCDAGIVKARKNGKWIRYSLDNDKLAEQSNVLADFLKPVQS